MPPHSDGHDRKSGISGAALAPSLCSVGASCFLPSNNLPFSDMPLFRASRIDEAEEHIARLVNPHRITVRKEAKKLDVSFNGIREDAITFLLIEYGATVEVRPEQSGDYFYVQTTVEGFSAVLQGNEQISVPEKNTVVVSPERPYQMHIASGTKRLVVGIKKNALERHLVRLCGRALDRPLRFRSESHSPAASKIWLTQIENLYSLFKLNPISYRNEICRRHYYDATCTLWLNLFANNHTDVLSTDSVDLAPRRCRAAMEYMREHVRTRVTVTDIAEHAGLSVRALQLSFQRYYNVTPAEALRNLRLDAVKVSLERCDPSTNITRVLLDFGISSFGHFAAQFRNRFGVTPSEVLWMRRRGWQRD